MFIIEKFEIYNFIYWELEFYLLFIYDIFVLICGYLLVYVFNCRNMRVIL